MSRIKAKTSKCEAISSAIHLVGRFAGRLGQSSITPLPILGPSHLFSSSIFGETTQNSQGHKEVANYPAKLAVRQCMKRKDKSAAENLRDTQIERNKREIDEITYKNVQIRPPSKKWKDSGSQSCTVRSGLPTPVTDGKCTSQTTANDFLRLCSIKKKILIFIPYIEKRWENITLSRKR